MSKPNTNQCFKSILFELKDTIERFESHLPLVVEAGNIIKNGLSAGRKIITAGNGGSAADAMHLVEELIGKFEKFRGPYSAISLCADPTVLTCIGNDFGFENIFARQVEGISNSGDILIVFSTSGNSINLFKAVEIASIKGLKTIALLGKSGGYLKGKCDVEIIVPSSNTARIQELHTLVLHMWLYHLEKEI